MMSEASLCECCQLKDMTKEEIINYFKTKMSDMKKEHEMKVREMTEEYDSFNREFCCLKDRVNSLLSANHCLIDMLAAEKREVKSLSSNLSDAAAKLLHHSMTEANFSKQIKKLECDVEDVNIESFLTEDIYKCVLREFTGEIKCDVVDSILSENQNLQDMLIYITKVVGTLFLQLFDAATKLSHHSMAEANFLKQIKKLECDTEDANIESFIREDIHKCVLRDLTSQIKCALEDSDIQDILVQETSLITFREYVRDAEATVNLLTTNYNEEKERGDHLEEKLLKNEDAFKKEKASLSALLEEKEKSMSEMGSRLAEYVRDADHALRDAEATVNLLMTNCNKEKERGDHLEEKLLKNEGAFKKENASLSALLEEKEKSMTEMGSRLTEQRKHLELVRQEVNRKMEYCLASIQGLAKSMANFECRVTEKIKQNCSTLDMLDLKCRPFAQKANLLKRKMLEYKQKLERRCSDLQMAEKEVDLLADKVDVLQSLLSKIYTALDRYSLILQNYPGIMEVLNLVRRELNRDTN